MGICWSCGAQVHGLRYLITCPTCEGVGVMKDVRTGIHNLAAAEQRGIEMLALGLSQLAADVSHVSDELSVLASVLEWGLEEIKWELRQQTRVLKGIDKTLKTPSQTQAREWRLMAEELRRRGLLKEAQEWFLKALSTSPLDYRTYIGLAMTRLQSGEFDLAREVLEKSLPHAPKCERVWVEPGSRLERLLNSAGRPTEFDLPMGATSQDVLHTLERWFGGRLERQGNLDATDAYFEWFRLSTDYECSDSYRIDWYISPFDYKSLSYRLIGRIFACKEDPASAASALRSAIQLSPHYPEGHYEYAQYCVLSHATEDWRPHLRWAISARSAYWYMARAERNFSRCGQDVDMLLSVIQAEARQRATETIAQAECGLAKAREIAARSPPERQSDLTEANRLLSDARSAAASNDYRKCLEADWLALGSIMESESPTEQPEVPVESPQPRGGALALTSLILGILSLCGGILVAIPAIVCGSIALNSMRKGTLASAHRGKALGGIVCGIVGTIVWTVIIILAATFSH